MNRTNAAPRSTRPVRCLVIQLARLGDTLQSLMALRAAKQLYPELEIHFMARENFIHAASRVSWLSSVIPCPVEKFVKPIMSGEGDGPAIQEAARWLQPLVTERWDFIVNWSYSDASSFLSALLPGRVKLGFSRAKDLSLICTDGWSHYIQAILQGGVDQNIHLTDILTTQLLTALQIHLGEPTDAGASGVTSKSFFSLKLSQSEAEQVKLDPLKRWIGVQLGASNDLKNWSKEAWSDFIGLILSRHPQYGIVLLGGKAEAETAAEIVNDLESTPQMKAKVGGRLVSLAGKTSFDGWASLIAHCHWVISPDTSALHLASVLGTRVLNISIGPVKWAETGPYGNGHYVLASLQPCPVCHTRTPGAEHTCREAVTAEMAYAVWLYASAELERKRNETIDALFGRLHIADQLPKLLILRSKIRNPNDGGGVVYEPLIRRPLEMREWSSQVLGVIARAWYCGWVPETGTELQRTRLGPALVRELRDLKAKCDSLSEMYDDAKKTSDSLHKRSSGLKSDRLMTIEHRQMLAAVGKKLLEIEQAAEKLAADHPALDGFSKMSKVMMHNLRGEGVTQISHECLLSFQQLQEGLKVLQAWLIHTLELARPVSIPSTVTVIGPVPERGSEH